VDDPTRRFAGRADAYASFRPSYPREVLRIVEEECGLTRASVVADVGSGTGKLAELFLSNGNRVLCVEPDPGMREAAERTLRDMPGFTSVAGRAEATTLADGSADLATAGQAFHWFDPTAAHVELARVLRAPRPVALVWNARRVDATPFLRAYERFLRDHGTDYAPTRHGRADPGALATFFGESGYRRRSVEHSDSLDRAGLLGRVHSASYMPAPGSPRHAAMAASLESLFLEHAQGGAVRFEFDTEVYTGRLG